MCLVLYYLIRVDLVRWPFLLAFLLDVSFWLFFFTCFVLVEIVQVAHHEYLVVVVEHLGVVYLPLLMSCNNVENVRSVLFFRLDMGSLVCLLFLSARVASRSELSQCDIVKCDFRSVC